MSEPYIRKQPHDLIRAADWNQIQVDTRTDIEQHDHTGGEKGTPLGTNALQDGAVTQPKIAEGAVGFDNLAQDIREVIQTAADGVAPELIEGAVQTEHLADTAVTGAKIMNGSVRAEHLINGAVTGTKLAVGAVRAEHIPGHTLQTGHLADGAVTDQNIAHGAVRAEHLAGDAVQSGHIADEAITAAKLAPDVVVPSKPAPGSVGDAEIADGAISGAKLTVGAVHTEHIRAGAVQTGHVADGAVTAAKIAGGAVRVDALAQEVREMLDPIQIERGSFDQATADWSWSYVQQAAIFPYTSEIDGFETALDTLKVEVEQRAGGERYPAFLRALRVLTDYLEPDVIKALGPSRAYDAINDSGMWLTLMREGLLDDDLFLMPALEIIGLAYESSHPSLFLALARLADVNAIGYAENYSYSYSKGYGLVEHMENFYSSSYSSLKGVYAEVLAGLATPVSIPSQEQDGDPLSLPFIKLPEITNVEDAIFEIEMKLRLYDNDNVHMSALGIGTEHMPPLPAEFTIVSPPYNTYHSHHSVTLRRRIRHRKGLGIPRTARLWGISHSNSGSDTLHLLNMRISARTVGRVDAMASVGSLEAMEGPFPSTPRNISPRTTEAAPATEEPAAEPTDPTES